VPAIPPTFWSSESSMFLVKVRIFWAQHHLARSSKWGTAIRSSGAPWKATSSWSSWAPRSSETVQRAQHRYFRSLGGGDEVQVFRLALEYRASEAQVPLKGFGSSESRGERLVKEDAGEDAL
jgi:hypothetical protein